MHARQRTQPYTFNLRKPEREDTILSFETSTITHFIKFLVFSCFTHVCGIHSCHICPWFHVFKIIPVFVFWSFLWIWCSCVRLASTAWHLFSQQGSKCGAEGCNKLNANEATGCHVFWSECSGVGTNVTRLDQGWHNSLFWQLKALSALWLAITIWCTFRNNKIFYSYWLVKYINIHEKWFYMNLTLHYLQI